jgi:hypothetical protein
VGTYRGVTEELPGSYRGVIEEILPYSSLTPPLTLYYRFTTHHSLLTIDHSLFTIDFPINLSTG